MPYISATAEIMYAPLDLLLVMDLPAQKFSNVLPEVPAGIFGIQAGKFAQNFFGALIPRHGDIHLYLKISSPPLASLGADWTPFSRQAKLLPGWCPGRVFRRGAPWIVCH